LATGVKDQLPRIEGASEAILRSLVCFCPICDAFEAIDKRIAVIGDGALGEREGAFLSHYSDRVTSLHVSAPKLGSDKRPPGVGGFERLVINLSDLHLLEDLWTSTRLRANAASMESAIAATDIHNKLRERM
jgi:thioredoxin reductase (NADPH)